MRTILVLACSLSLLSACGTPDPSREASRTLRNEFEQRGLTMLPLPGNMYVPGTLLEAAEVGDQFKIACFAEQARPGLTPHTSPTATWRVAIDRSTTLRGNAALEELARIAASHSTEATFNVRIEDATLLEIDSGSLQGGSVHQSCLDHLGIKCGTERMNRLKMIMRALKASVAVDVTFDRTTSVTARTSLVDAVKRIFTGAHATAEANLEAIANGSATVTGKELIWAVVSDKQSANDFVRGAGACQPPHM